jgi:Cupin-like domain
MREFASPDDEIVRREVIAGGRPTVLRGFVRHWPIVAAGAQGARGVLDGLRRFDNGTPVDALMTPPEVEGRVFYNDAMTGFNFIRNRLALSAVAEQVMRYSAFPRAPAVAVQSALIRDCLPGFSEENRLTVLDDTVLPRIWLGNAITTPTHLDEWHNIGCVVAGRRRFTLFPPEQIANLYIGPIDFAPTGAPMSLVSLHAPDFERFPRFRDALETAVTAELGPGDAVYIPPLWWHHVESIERFNVLVNYWWHALPGVSTTHAESGFDSLVYAILNLRSLPPATRDAWRALFEHFVFADEAEATGHIPPHRHGLLGHLSPADRDKVREYLFQHLKR